MPDRRRPRNRWTNLAKPQTREGLRVEAALSSPSQDTVAELWLYDLIDEFGGEWGISAAMVAEALSGIDANRLLVHINSPGGSFFEGVAIHNLLRQHSAEVHILVDGLAASAASVIAMAGSHIKMGVGSQLMIHRASGCCWGTADDMRGSAVKLDQTDADIAAIYAARAGGTPEQWMAALKVETWYTAAQAVTAGLADEMTPLGAAPDQSDEDDEPEPDEGEQDKPAAVAALAGVDVAALAAELAPLLRPDSVTVGDQMPLTFATPGYAMATWASSNTAGPPLADSVQVARGRYEAFLAWEAAQEAPPALDDPTAATSARSAPTDEAPTPAPDTSAAPVVAAAPPPAALPSAGPSSSELPPTGPSLTELLCSAFREGVAK